MHLRKPSWVGWMASAQSAVDLQIGIISARGVANETVGTKQVAEAASVSRTGWRFLVLVDLDAGERAVPLQRLSQQGQHLVVVQMARPCGDNGLHLQEHFHWDYGLESTIAANPLFRRVANVLNFQLER